MNYAFPAVFDYGEDGISVTFPDLPGCITCGKTDEEALYMARDALALYLYASEKDGDEIPDPSNASEIQLGDNQKVIVVNVLLDSDLRAKIDESTKRVMELDRLGFDN